jgi:pentatricopeptide repeat protein
MNHSGHRHCLQQPWVPVQCQQRQYARRRGNDVVVHEYEQVGSDKKTRVAVNPKADLEATRDYLKSKLERLDRELAEMQEGPFGPHSEFIKSLSPEERIITLEALQKGETTSHDDDDCFDQKELDRLIDDQYQGADSNVDNDLLPRVTLDRSTQHRGYIRFFNAALEDMATGTQTEAKKINLWMSYQRCRRHMPDFLTLLPSKVWDMLWQSQVDLPDNASNLKALAKDALAHAMPLSTQQLVVYIETLWRAGDLTLAIERWTENRGTLGPNPEVARQFWTLGVQLHCENGQTLEAENIARQCLRYGTFADTTILLPVIISLVQKNTTESLEKAWACYLHFKEKLGTGIKPKDYESISMALLNRGHPTMALAVFKDMILDSAKPNYFGYNSVSAFRNLVGHAGKGEDSAVTEQQVSRASLVALTVLPRFLQNKFFYASWIKRLIGLGELDTASKVVELMYERGVRPDARHLNGIVGAWLRDGSVEAREKAEQMAWSMVQARIDFVRRRQMGKRTPEMIKSFRGQNLPPFVNRLVPSATLETFSILLLHYARYFRKKEAEDLMEVMSEQAMIKPNAFICNHWIRTSLRAQDLEAVWVQYQKMKHQIKPDLETFACLWDAAKVQWDPSRSAHYKNFPTARRLFKEMSDWMSRLPKAQLIRAKQEYSRELHDQIIRVFCLSADLRGTLCVLHGLQNLFNECPDDATSRIVTISIARLLPADDPGRDPSGRHGSRRKVSSMRLGMRAVDEILQLVTDQRAISLMDAGLDLDHLDAQTAKQLRLDVLSDLLVIILKRLASQVRGNVENDVKNVAHLMGVDLAAVDFRKEEVFES